MKPLSIKTKLSLGLSALLLLTFAVTNFITYTASKASIRHNIIDDALPLISNNIYSDIQKDLITPINVSSLMANDTFLKDWVLNGEKNTGEVIKYLREIKDKYGFFTTFLISERTRIYYSFKGVHKRISTKNAHDVWYFNFKKLNVDYDLDVDTDEVSQGTLTIFINHRLNDYQGNLLGVTGVGLSMERVGALLASYQDKYQKNIFLVDGNGLVQVHRDKKLIHKVNLSQMEGLGRFAKEILGSKTKSTVHEYDLGGKHIIVISRFIPEFGWYLMVEQVENAVLQEIKANFIRNLIIGLVATLIVIAIVILMVNYFQGRLERLATTDELTQAHNRRHFLELGAREFARAQRSEAPLALLMVDADHFKKINDRYGHLTGDKVLENLARTMGGQLRSYDLFGRWGGEEFAILLPHTSFAEAQKAAARILRAVDAMEAPDGTKTCTVTVSIGVAVTGGDISSLEELVKKADNALYQAKSLGRNQVYPPPADPA